VIDLYLYNRRIPDAFDRMKAEKLLKQVGLYDFEQRLLALTRAWFETGVLSEMDMKLTDYIMEAGIYGDSRIMSANTTKDPEIANEVRRKKILFYIFPSKEVMTRLYPGMMKYPAMLPVAWVRRWCKGAFTSSRDKAVDNLKKHNDVDKSFVSHVSEMISELHLNKEDIQ